MLISSLDSIEKVDSDPLGEVDLNCASLVWEVVVYDKPSKCVFFQYGTGLGRSRASIMERTYAARGTVNQTWNYWW